MTRVLLLTGATGHVGGELARRFVLAGDRLLALVRPGSDALVPSGAQRIEGDVTLEDLGMDAPTARTLARTVTDVVHAAADTRFRAPPPALTLANVVGTERVLDFAGRCRRLVKFTHVSTLYVAGLTPGRVFEEPSAARAFANEYQRSKRDAEEAVLARMARLPAAIVRSSTWIGDSRDGTTTHPNFVHALIRLLARAPLPVTHVDADAPLDAVATDWAADALAALHRYAPPGAIYHVTASDDAVTVGRALAEVDRAYRVAGRADVHLPAVVDATTWARFVNDARKTAPPLLLRVLDGLEAYLPHFRIRQTFDDRRAAAALAGRVRPRPSSLETLRRVLRRTVAADATEGAPAAAGLSGSCPAPNCRRVRPRVARCPPEGPTSACTSSPSPSSRPPRRSCTTSRSSPSRRTSSPSGTSSACRPARPRSSAR